MTTDDIWLDEELRRQQQRRNDRRFWNLDAAKAKAYIKRPGSDKWEEVHTE